MIFLRCVGVLGLAASTAAQTTWYVSSASMGPGSGTLADPYASIQQAISEPTTLDGDTIVALSGTYVESIDFIR